MMTLEEVLQYYKQQTELQNARVARAQESNLWPLMEGTQGDGAMRNYDPIHENMTAINNNPVMQALRAPAQTLAEFATKPSINTGYVLWSPEVLNDLPILKIRSLFDF